jgi:hypothetical protein
MLGGTVQDFNTFALRRDEDEDFCEECLDSRSQLLIRDGSKVVRQASSWTEDARAEETPDAFHAIHVVAQINHVVRKLVVLRMHGER